uniref:Uncharacterized protein n=2 Tax=Xenopus tropicalis TaxID=8364 RepID=A0A803JTA1_XENTR
MFQRNFYDPMYTFNYPISFSPYNAYLPPMIAAFWADADMRQLGELYYQTYDFQMSPTSDIQFKTQLENEIYSYFTLNITALWAIKITWEQVLPFPYYYFKSSESNTYQAVLVTNGVYSFCLMSYDDGGMNWRYDELPTTYLPKMGYFSNTATFNDPQTIYSGDLQNIYTPDQYKGLNTNRTGYWAYRLDKNTANTKNSWQQCLSWYYNEPYPYWSYYTPPCPCSWLQATFDSSYTSSSNLQSYRFPRKSSDNSFTYQSSFPSIYGGGTRCYYYSSGSLIYGEKERFLPTPWTSVNYWLWWSDPQLSQIFWKTTLPQLTNQYQVNEVDPYENCCNSGSPYLCYLYSLKRPRDSCYGYIPPKIGFFFGDPHINTLDGVQYTFNGLGEFTLVNVMDDNGTIFTLQGRTARAGTNATSQATNFVALAADISNVTTIEWQLSNENMTIVMINGSVIPLSAGNVTALSKATLEITSEGEVNANFEGGISLSVTAKLGALSFVTTLDASYQNKTEGLLGVFNGDKTDDLKYSNGTVLSYNGVKLPNESLIFDMGMTWKTTPQNSIFTYNSTNNESWYTYNNNSFVPLFYDELLLTTNETLINSANSTCKGNNECIFDILSTGNFALGQATLGTLNAAIEQSSTMNNFPPNITGPSTIKAALNTQVTVSYTATDQNNDPVVFSVLTNSADVNITPNGLLTWNPKSSDPINITIQANDSKAVTDLALTLVLCNCSNNSSCLYDQTITLSNYMNFKMAGCNCSAAWTGMYCNEDFDGCIENKCYVNNSCNDTKAPGVGFTCDACPNGMTGDGIQCADIDECYLNISSCEQICNNIPERYSCSCMEGYQVNQTNSSKCEDIDECSNSTIYPCANNTVCINTPGSYSCQCMQGYQGNPTLLCVDINECTNVSICPNTSTCSNTAGSYLCNCLPGYSGNNCTDINECEINNTCSLNSICTNTIGSYSCYCKTGYSGDNCTDIDECANYQNDCGSYSQCINTIGSYNCFCVSGYTGDGKQCAAIETTTNPPTTSLGNVTAVASTVPVTNGSNGFSLASQSITQTTSVSNISAFMTTPGFSINATIVPSQPQHSSTINQTFVYNSTFVTFVDSTNVTSTEPLFNTINFTTQLPQSQSTVNQATFVYNMTATTSEIIISGTSQIPSINTTNFTTPLPLSQSTMNQTTFVYNTTATASGNMILSTSQIPTINTTNFTTPLPQSQSTMNQTTLVYNTTATASGNMILSTSQIPTINTTNFTTPLPQSQSTMNQTTLVYNTTATASGNMILSTSQISTINTTNFTTPLPQSQSTMNQTTLVYNTTATASGNMILSTSQIPTINTTNFTTPLPQSQSTMNQTTLVNNMTATTSGNMILSTSQIPSMNTTNFTTPLPQPQSTINLTTFVYNTTATSQIPSINTNFTTPLPQSQSTTVVAITTTTTKPQTTTAAATTTSATTTTTATSTKTSAANGGMLKPVTLFNYSTIYGDTPFVVRSTDFTSPLIQPQMGFPFGGMLHDSLYYTDNGQIIFPASQNDIFNYTNPPVGGFTSNYPVAMIAVFWDDADFSKNVGTTYYQVYTKSSTSTNSNNVFQDVENMVKKYVNSTYAAEWTMKITWEKAPAYPAKSDDTQTNTYQAVLTTDGYVSYVLMLYKDGEMNWDVTNRASNLVIGYSSGNFFKNDDQMNRPPSKKYRPNMFQGYNAADVRGLWIYTLNSNAVDNNRMTCLNWVTSEPDPSQWNSNLLSCPCLYQQGLSDFRFRPTKAGQSGSITMLRTSFPSSSNAGIRCLYYRKNQFIEGFQEKKWIFSSVGTDPELWAYDTCCNQVDDPQFCLMYMQKRPLISCRSYRPLFPAWMFGDPHISTLDGFSYTFNGLGDFILLNATDTDTSFILQGRTEQTGSAMATNFKAFAVQYTSGTTTVTAQWYLETDGNITTYVNNQLVLFSFSDDMEALINNSNSDVFLVKNNSITATFGGLISVSVSAYSGIMNAITNLPTQFFGKSQGLLGVWNSDTADDLQMPNGTVISTNSSEQDIYNYGLTWTVSGMNLFSLFQSRAIQRSASTFEPVFLSDLIKQYSSNYVKLTSLCAGNTECIYDGLTTNDTNLALSAQQASVQFQDTKTILSAVPPFIFGNDTIQAFMKQAVTVQYTSNGTGVTFAAAVPYQDVNISSNGLLIWTPTSTQGFTLQLTATDSKNYSSALDLKFVVCSCLLASECNYTQSTTVNATSLSIASCTCTTNYTGSFCSTPPNPCVQGCYPGVSCSNTTGCGSCPAGFTGDGLHCNDIDECLQNGTCSVNAICTNIVPGYNCTCKTGFYGNGSSCTDINECNTSPCDPNAVCNNTPGSYTCTCKSGYTGNGTSCNDINECNNSPCDPNAVCNNTQGSYTCTCKSGYTGNGISCTDINECNTSPCDTNAVCNNTQGSYTCTCKSGFMGNGISCTDINECNTSPCDTNAVCANTPGSYTCTCNSGYTGNGTKCSSCGSCASDYCYNFGTCTWVGSNCAQTCTCTPSFSGDRCQNAKNTFSALLSSSVPKRTIYISFNPGGPTNESIAFSVVAILINTDSFAQFSRFSNFTFINNSLAKLTAEFDYAANTTIINQLNNDLVNNVKITLSINKGISRSSTVYTYQDVQSGATLTVDQLLKYASCNVAGYSADSYQLNSSFGCVSKCVGYCQNDGVCTLLPNQTICSCTSYSIYTVSGSQCEHLSMNLNAFFGILFGALAFLFLLMLGIGLAIYFCRRKEDYDDTERIFPTKITVKKSPLSSFTTIKESTLPTTASKNGNEPHLVSWKAYPNKIDNLYEVTLKRPEPKPE